MSKKNRNRRVPTGSPTGAAAGEQMIETSFAALWDAIDAGDLLSAEVEAATLLALPVRAEAPADRTRGHQFLAMSPATFAARSSVPLIVRSEG